MSIFRDIINDLSELGTPVNKLKSNIVNLTKQLTDYSYDKYPYSKELAKQKIIVQLNEIIELSRKCNPFEIVRIYFPNKTVATTVQIVISGCKEWVNYIVEKNIDYSSNLLIDIIERNEYNQNPNNKYPRAFYIISKHLECDVSQVKDIFLDGLAKQEFSKDELIDSIKGWLQKNDKESQLFDLEINETPSSYYALWTKEYMQCSDNSKDFLDVEDGDENLEEKNESFYFKEKLFSGNLIGKYDSGKIRFRIEFRDGKMDGEYIVFYEDGSVYTKSLIFNNEKNGLEIENRNNGTKKFEYLWENGVLKSKTLFYETGEKRKQTPMIYMDRYKDYVPHGEEINWDRNGVISETYYWEYGLPKQ